MVIQWYPGHMTKAKRMMQEDIKLIDLVIELLDARAPLSSRNPDIDELGKNKARLILLNKYDLADDAATAKWVNYFKNKGFHVVKINARTRDGIKKINEEVMLACASKIERDRARGIKNRPIRAMVCGIPNVGKSTFINSYAGKAAAKTGNKPGVTKGKQWIKLSKEIELLDTPGILWPKFDDQIVGRNLALIGSVKDDVVNVTELTLELIDFLMKKYPAELNERYGINAQEVDRTELSKSAQVLGEIAIKRGALARAGEPDYDKAAALILDDLRSAKIGKITLETPEE